MSYTWFVSLKKDKKGITIVNAFQNILDKSTKLHSMRKPNKIWVDKGSEFHNSCFKKSLKNSDIEMQSTHNRGKYVVAKTLLERIRTKFISI